VAEETPDSTTKRRIVKNPETFRERAVKAVEQEGQISRKRKVVGAPLRGLRVIFSPIGRLLVRFAKLKVFRFLAKPFRIIGRILVPRYIRNAWKELRQVTWPSWTESRRLTSAVIIFAFVFGVIIAVVDYGLDKLFKALLLK
jgi:preprotein translocase SecE subunit